MEYKLIPTDEVPERNIKTGWFKIIEEFVKSGEKFSYIQFDSKEEMQRSYGGLHSTGRNRGVKISQYTHLMRIYFTRASMI